MSAAINPLDLHHPLEWGFLEARGFFNWPKFFDSYFDVLPPPATLERLAKLLHESAATYSGTSLDCYTGFVYGACTMARPA